MNFDQLADVAEKVTAIDQSQSALLENGKSIQEQLDTMMALITSLIQLLTTKPEQKGLTLNELLAQILGQLKENNKIQTLNYEILLLLKEKALQASTNGALC